MTTNIFGVKLVTANDVHPSLFSPDRDLSAIAADYVKFKGLDTAVEKLLTLDLSNTVTSPTSWLLGEDTFSWSEAKSEVKKACKPGKWGIFYHDSLRSDTVDVLPYSDSASIFDVETFVKGDEHEVGYPIFAQIMNRDYTAVWTHQSFDGVTEYQPVLIDLPDNMTVIAHSSGFDSSRVSNKFFLNPRLNILCTLGMVNAVYGAAEEVRWALKLSESHPMYQRRAGFIKAIKKTCTALSLVASYEFLTGKKLPDDVKDARKLFVKAKKFSEFIVNYDDLLEYSISDLYISLEVAKRIIPTFIAQTKNYTQLSAMNMLARSVVPVMTDRDEWLRKADEKAKENTESVFALLDSLVEEVYEAWTMGDRSFEGATPDLNWKKVSKSAIVIPTWVKEWRDRSFKLGGYGLQALLQMQFRDDKGGWFDVIRDRTAASKGGIGLYYGNKQPIKHIKITSSDNVSNLISGEFLSYIEDYKGITLEQPRIRSKVVSDAQLNRIMRLLDANSMHVGFSGRANRQIISNGIASCEVQVAGTVSGRNVDGLFLTMPARCKHPKEKVMFSLASTHHAPKGKTFIAFDFASQELAIAALYSDAYRGSKPGSTPLSLSIINGDKANGTDPHNVLAKKAQVSRDLAKNGVYGFVYGAGAKTTSKTLSILLDVATAMVDAFKGKKGKLGVYSDGVASDYYNYSYRNISNNKPLPILGVLPNPSLSPKLHGGNSLPAQLNFRIQATAGIKGMLTTYLLLFWQELQDLGITEDQCSLSLTIHDQIIYICDDDEALIEKIARAMFRAHHGVWQQLYDSEGVDLPINISHRDLVIDVTKILRKEASKKIYDPTWEYNELGYQYAFNLERGDLDLYDYRSGQKEIVEL